MAIQKYQAPSPDIDWDNPNEVRARALSVDEALRRFSDEVSRKASSPKNIVINGDSLDVVLDRDTAWTGVMWYVDGTLDEVRRQASLHGFEVCDGQGGTPDTRHRFLRGAGANQDAGDCGESTGICIEDIIPCHQFCVCDHDSHYHTIGVVCSCNHLECVVIDAEGTGTGSVPGHTHGGQTCPEDVSSHEISVVGGGVPSAQATLSHGGEITWTSDTLPPYYEAIIVRKK